MEYQRLAAITDTQHRQDELLRRQQMPGTISTATTSTLVEMIGASSNLVFVVPTQQLQALSAQIFIQSAQLQRLLTSLDSFAQQMFLLACQDTEYDRQFALSTDLDPRQFPGLRMRLREISDGHFRNFTAAPEVYQLYRQLASMQMVSELGSQQFRQLWPGLTDAHSFSNVGARATDITDDLNHIGAFSQTAAQANPLINLAMTYYLYEQVRPFYDGNCLTGRLIIANQLGQITDSITALSVAQALTSVYDQLETEFQLANRGPNEHELTEFVTTFLTGVVQAQAQQLAQLKNKSAYPQPTAPLTLTALPETIYTKLAIASIFGPANLVFDIKSLVRLTGTSAPTVTKAVNQLIDLQLVNIERTRPLAIQLK
ncbi:hypothetical protein EQG49_10195 [Periweissella cryptocerci]|uniref:Fido domain-containing protein n=1 Tax=Periweissella cryptocerci TaxID=2506420 RepID=A0A4P6YVM9_9LACO|nr:Fic family protein [Periweissella cryptocerci]QBO36806.1 hypothetical protein EQG49_10195 [Periweissella cryptocerci]